MDSVINIFLWKSCITTILSQGRAYLMCYLKCIKNNWNGNFSDFIDLQEKDRFGRSCLILLKLLALYLAITCSWQLSNSSH